MNHTKMTEESYLEYLKNDIHSTVFSTVDFEGKPSSRIIDIMLVKNKKVYFLTAITKPFYKELINNPFVSITGVKGEESMSSLSITLKGQVKEIGTQYLDEIFEKNDYMNEIYETEESKNVLRVFEIELDSVSVYDLSKKPIYQNVFLID
ncbi:TPA: pyridoxamine 5'-phosphate oxidase family protein [Listeria monocytogenes]